MTDVHGELLEAEDSVMAMGFTAQIVTAAIGRSLLTKSEEVPAFIRTIHATFMELAGFDAAPTAEKKEPAVDPKKSVHPDYIVCLEDGNKFKSLKRHISTHYGLSPDEYRAKWGLPSSYPMVAPNYAAKRSALAKASGLGLKKAA
ncbi:MucR family transcriptional regulator [Mesorhizobium sp. M0189]|uniref:MucR family transcriptional regulator n=1 Tax=Mesorhizobium sp. M0189 TaxID=2956909 RepID=UPI003336D184